MKGEENVQNISKRYTNWILFALYYETRWADGQDPWMVPFYVKTGDFRSRPSSIKATIDDKFATKAQMNYVKARIERYKVQTQRKVFLIFLRVLFLLKLNTVSTTKPMQ